MLKENAYFSCFGKKSTKRSRHRGGAVRLASSRARAALPCVPHPARTYDSAEHLNLHPEHSKNVPIFAMQAGAVQYRQGGESGAAANSKVHP